MMPTFKEATDRLRLKAAEIAEIFGVSAQTARQFRLHSSKDGHRTPPKEWHAVLSLHARERSGDLLKLAEELFVVEKWTLPAVDPAPDGQRSVLKPAENPALVGNGPDTLLCGKCDSVLAEQVWPEQLLDIYFECSECGSVSETQKFRDHRIHGRCLYLPVGTYRRGTALKMPHSTAFLVGEARPGVGPPTADSVVTLDPDETTWP